MRAPDTLTGLQSSTLPCAGLTAWTALVERGRLRAGQTVVVIGTGGVSIFGMQIALMHGAEVIVVSGDDKKLAWA
ncbi:NAD(P)-dependent alcohol dehydrogenase, partial [Mycobacterium tuberculosis]|nr:NAD(P)-dependent alcohol dehydrogenase [Mycobacterium tuberculosis]